MQDKIMEDHRCRACLKEIKTGQAYREVPIRKSYGDDYGKLLEVYKYCVRCSNRLGFVPQKPGEDEKYFWSGFEKGIFANPLRQLRYLTPYETIKANSAAKGYK